jgi:hypothetical protein
MTMHCTHYLSIYVTPSMPNSFPQTTWTIAFLGDKTSVYVLSIMLSPNVAALPPVADSCDLPVHDLAIMLPPHFAALPSVADSCDLPVHDLAIMLPPNVAAFHFCR